MINRQHNVNERVKFLARLMMFDTIIDDNQKLAEMFGMTPQSISRLKTGIITSGTAHLLMDYLYKENFSSEPAEQIILKAQKKVLKQIEKEKENTGEKKQTITRYPTQTPSGVILNEKGERVSSEKQTGAAKRFVADTERIARARSRDKKSNP